MKVKRQNIVIPGLDPRKSSVPGENPSGRTSHCDLPALLRKALQAGVLRPPTIFPLSPLRSLLAGNPVRRLLIGILFTIILLSTWIFFPPSKKPLSLSPTLSTDFAYDSKTFLASVADTKIVAGQIPPKIIVIPHHLTASPLIAKGILSLSGETTPKTIIIFSPLHSDLGNCDIVTSTTDWSTSYGTVEVDKTLQAKLLDSKTTCSDDKAFETEHGIAGLLPFIKYYYPKAKIVPFALKKYIDQSNLEAFIKTIINLKGDETAYVTSIDFSHGLSLKESLMRDKQTEKLIVECEYSQIEELTQENADSPASLTIAMKIAANIGTKLSVIDHKNSSDFNNSTTSVTSYFLLAATPLSSATSPSHSGPDPESIKIVPISISQPPTVIPAKAGIHSITPNSPDAITLVFGGDVMLGRTVNTRMIKYKDYTWPFLKIADILKGADITMVNLESPFKSGCTPTDSGMVFCADPKSIEGLNFAGIDVANLANNHILNQGKAGLDETISLLDKNKIVAVGADPRIRQETSNIVTINKTTIAFIGFNDIGGSGENISTATPVTVKSQIEEAAKVADFVVATFHFGNEYSKRSVRQQELSRLAIDSGADIVIGHHPHWVQESEEYKGKPIYYSLGNLVFDQMWSTETRRGLIVRITLEENKLINREEFPVIINDYGQPTPAN